MKSFFSCNVLTHEEIVKKLGKKWGEKFEASINCNKLEDELADRIAKIISKWAARRGAKFYAHLFFPLSGKPALKFMSFLGPDGKIEFNGQTLLKSETDASSFPSGGNRTTAKAKGYALWDRQSPIFIDELDIGKVLFLPSFLISHTGEALDEKAALFRASHELDKHLTSVLNKFGQTCEHVYYTVGFEQEFFLIDKENIHKFCGLAECGRTLANEEILLKSQFYGHYFSLPETKVQFFMKRLYEELLPLGVVLKAMHSEVAPCQYEVVPIYDRVEYSYLKSQIITQKIKDIASKCGLVAIFHEKPFNGVNGSGKHNNWSLSADLKHNLLDYKTANKDIFMFLMSCIIAAVHKHSDLIRLSVSSYSNDMRLGGNEAPPPLLSVYVGDEVQHMIDKILGRKVGYHHGCDRNRTSPFAYTGNKFEFRMLGSNQSIALCNTIIMTALLDEVKRAEKVFVDRGYNIKTLRSITYKNLLISSSVIFNGDNYSSEWGREAKHRGLKRYDDFLDTVDLLKKKENILFLNTCGVMSREEIKILDNVRKESYVSGVLFEAKQIIYQINTHINIKLQNTIENAAKYDENTPFFPCDCENKYKNLQNCKLGLDGVSSKLTELLDSLKNAKEPEKWDIIKAINDHICEFNAVFGKIKGFIQDRL